MSDAWDRACDDYQGGPHSRYCLNCGEVESAHPAVVKPREAEALMLSAMLVSIPTEGWKL